MALALPLSLRPHSAHGVYRTCAIVRQDAKRHGRVVVLPLVGELDLTCTKSEMVSLVMGAALAAAYTRTRHWALNNVFGITFCIQVRGCG